VSYCRYKFLFPLLPLDCYYLVSIKSQTFRMLHYIAPTMASISYPSLIQKCNVEVNSFWNKYCSQYKDKLKMCESGGKVDQYLKNASGNSINYLKWKTSYVVPKFLFYRHTVLDKNKCFKALLWLIN
jgi:hypothetical protein